MPRHHLGAPSPRRQRPKRLDDSLLGAGSLQRRIRVRSAARVDDELDRSTEAMEAAEVGKVQEVVLLEQAAFVDRKVAGGTPDPCRADR